MKRGTARGAALPGFTLIEVLIVIVVLGIIFGVGSVQFRGFARRQAVVSAKRQLLADIRSSQADAVSGRKPPGCSGTLVGYGSRVTSSSPAAYQTFAVCDSEVVIKQVQIPDVAFSVNFSSPPTPSGTLIFLPLARGTNLSAGVRMRVDITNSSSSSSLVVEASGEIQ